MSRPRVCLVEDDPIMGESLADRFGLEGFEIEWHRCGATALRALGERPYAAVISDIRLPDISGDRLFEEAADAVTRVTPFVFITGYGSIERAVALLQRGAADYVTKPFDIGALVDKVRALTGMPPEAPPREGESVLGVSEAMRRLDALVSRVAGRATAVLVTGESGVGKEVLARRLHALAAGAETGGPFVAVNCGALPETLLESEFFGYERGAFTGADRQRRGLFEQAHRGTLFLDEIGELPLPLQVKLLRALQERCITRLGGEQEIPVSFRLVCATSRDLAEQVRGGRFREDLYYRINVVELRIPPLRQRPRDVLWLANRIVAEVCGSLGEAPKVLHPSVEPRLLAHPWPGNVRELRNRLERACVLAEREVLYSEDVFEATDPAEGDLADARTLEAHLALCERLYLEAALKAHGWRIAETAAALGISRKNLWEKMRRYRLDAT